MSDQNCMNPGCDFRQRVYSADVPPEDRAIKLKQCSACKKVAYCSRECQRVHWTEHKPICKKLRDSSNIPAMDDFATWFTELEPSLYGTHAPVSERLRWHSTSDSDAKSREAMTYLQALDMEHVIQYATEKFIGYGKGAVVFNLARPIPHVEGSGRFLWAPVRELHRTDDPLLYSMAAEYNPERSAVIVLLLPAEDGLTADVWAVEPSFTIPPPFNKQVKTAHQAWVREWETPKASKSNKRRK